MIDILSCQLINRFEGMKSVVTSYQVLKPSFLSIFHVLILFFYRLLFYASHIELEARKFSNKFSDNISPLFPSRMLSIKTSFKEKIAHLKSTKEMVFFLNC